MTTSSLHSVPSLIALLGLSSCMAQEHDDAMRWNDINYVKVACTGEYANSPGCRYDEDEVDVGRRGGKGK